MSEETETLKAWDIMEKEKRTRLPVGEVWMEARKVCRMENSGSKVSIINRS